jgi:serine/threonine protein kinase
VSPRPGRPRTSQWGTGARVIMLQSSAFPFVVTPEPVSMACPATTTAGNFGVILPLTLTCRAPLSQHLGERIDTIVKVSNCRMRPQEPARTAFEEDLLKAARCVTIGTIKSVAASHTATVNEISAYRMIGWHAAIVRVFFAKILAGQGLIVMEKAHSDCYTLLEQRGAFGDADAATVLGDICSGVSHMHACGLAHCDLKLENVLAFKVQEGVFTYKICDLGHCQRTFSKLCNVTPSYDAPERFSEGLKDMQACDAWSIGVCVAALLTNRLLIEVTGDMQKRYEHILRDEEGADHPRLLRALLSNIRNVQVDMELLCIVENLLWVNIERRMRVDECWHRVRGWIAATNGKFFPP